MIRHKEGFLETYYFILFFCKTIVEAAVHWPGLVCWIVNHLVSISISQCCQRLSIIATADSAGQRSLFLGRAKVSLQM